MDATNKTCIVCGDKLTKDNCKSYRLKNYIYKCNNCINEEKRKWASEKYRENIKKFRNRSLQFNKRLLAKNPKKYKCRQMYSSARKRAKQKGFSFNITSDYLYSIAPDICPILGVKIDYACNSKNKNSASLDRIDSSIGYVVGNVQIISYLANLMKSNASIDEQIRFAEYVIENYIQRKH